MSLSAAKWKVITGALTEAGVDSELIDLVERARNAHDTVQGMARMLLGGADVSQAKNYVKVEMVGLIPPFDRVYIELSRSGGKTSHELRELLRDRLMHVKRCMTSEHIHNDAFRSGIEQGIDEDLATESP
jgi:hypothetical protein